MSSAETSKNMSSSSSSSSDVNRLVKDAYSNHLSTLFKYILISYLTDEDCSSVLKVSKIDEFDIANLLGIDLLYNDYALLFACKYGRLSVVQFIAEKGVANYHDALQIASGSGHLSVVQFLVEKGTDKISNDDLYNAFLAASGYGHLSVIQYLFPLVNNDDEALYDHSLRQAIVGRHLSVIKFLIERSAHVDSCPFGNDCPFQFGTVDKETCYKFTKGKTNKATKSANMCTRRHWRETVKQWGKRTGLYPN